MCSLLYSELSPHFSYRPLCSLWWKCSWGRYRMYRHGSGLPCGLFYLHHLQQQAPGPALLCCGKESLLRALLHRKFLVCSSFACFAKMSHLTKCHSLQIECSPSLYFFFHLKYVCWGGGIKLHIITFSLYSLFLYSQKIELDWRFVAFKICVYSS